MGITDRLRKLEAAASPLADERRRAAESDRKILEIIALGWLRRRRLIEGGRWSEGCPRLTAEELVSIASREEVECKSDAELCAIIGIRGAEDVRALKDVTAEFLTKERALNTSLISSSATAEDTVTATARSAVTSTDTAAPQRASDKA